MLIIFKLFKFHFLKFSIIFKLFKFYYFLIFYQI